MMRIAFCVLLLAALPVLAQTATLENQPFPMGVNAVKNVPGGSFNSAGVVFNNDYNAGFDSWTGFSYSKVVNITTAGFTNEFAAYVNPLPANAGAGGSQNYAVAYDGSGFGAPPVITMPAFTRPTSFEITNTTYAALSMLNGDSFAKKFGGPTGNDPDYLKLTITGRDAGNMVLPGGVEFYLADYRFSNNASDYVINQWTTLDLSTLGDNTRSLHFAFESTDVSFGFINTPTYFAVDNVSVAPIPEPSLLAGICLLGLGMRTLRRRVAKLK